MNTKVYGTAFNAEEVRNFLVETNQPLYNWSKLSEELFELGEVVMKKINKDGTPKEPSIDKFIEETGDVLLRLDILATKLDIKDKISDRIVNKLNTQFAGYIEKRKYIGRI